MSTTNGWDIVCGFNQDYLSELAAYLYDSGKFPHTFQTGIYDLTLDPPTLTISTESQNSVVFSDTFQGTQGGKPIAGSLNIAVDISKMAAAYVGQPSYLRLSGDSPGYASCGDPGSINSQGCTLEAWIKTSATDTQNILVFGQTAPGLSLSNNRLSLFWGGVNTSPDQTDVSDGNWHHVAVVVEANEITFYKDGQAKDTLALFGGTTQSSSGDLNLGQADGDNAAFAGEMAQVRVWNVARTAQEIQQAMNVRLSGDEAGLIGYWTFAGGAVVNQVNGQTGSLQGGATITEETTPTYSFYLYFFDPAQTFKVTSDVTTGTTTGDNKLLDTTVTEALEAFASSAHVMGSSQSGAVLYPTTVNFITQTDVPETGVSQMLALMMTGNRMQPSEDPNQAFADDFQLMIPSGNNAVVGLWDYVFLDYILAPALAKALDVPASELVVTQGEPSVLTFDGETQLNQMQLTYMKIYINSEGLYMGFSGYIFYNGLVFAQCQATLNVVVDDDTDSPAEQPAPSPPRRLLFSFQSSPAAGPARDMRVKLWNPRADASSGDSLSLTFSLINLDVRLYWNTDNPTVESCKESWLSLPGFGECLTACCQGLLALLQDRIEDKLGDWQKTVTRDQDGRFKLNEIVFNDGFILFGTLTPGRV